MARTIENRRVVLNTVIDGHAVTVTRVQVTAPDRPVTVTFLVHRDMRFVANYPTRSAAFAALTPEAV